MHYAAAKDDKLGRQYQNIIGQSLCQIIGFQIPDLISVLQLDSLLSPSLLNGRTCCQSFQTGLVIRTLAFIVIILSPAHQNMPGFRMQHTMKEFPFCIDAGTYTSSNCQINNVLLALRLTKGYFTKRRAIYVRIKAYRTAKAFFKSPDNIVILPRQLGCAGDIPVGRRILIRIDRSKAANSQCFYFFCLKPLNHFRHGCLRCLGRDRNLLEDLSLFIANGAYHFGSASFQCSNSHSLPSRLPQHFFILCCFSSAFQSLPVIPAAYP